VPVPPPLSSVRATRRTTIAAASALALAGCRWGPAEDDADATPEPDSDAALVERAVVAIIAAADVVDQTRTRHIGLDRAMQPLLDLHVAHLRFLPAAEFPGQSVVVPDRSQLALAMVVTRERELQGQLAEFAIEAESGQLAQAFASMSASVAQHLAVLPELGKGPA